jgi:hypothetical protein
MNRLFIKTFLLVVSSFGALTISMANPMAGKIRVDLVSNEVGFQSFSVNSGGAIVGRNSTDDGVPHTLIGYWDADDVWETGTVTFVPTESGKVNLLLLGPYVVKDEKTKEMQVVRACFDDIDSDEVVIRNGHFANLNNTDLPREWLLNSFKTSNPIINEDNQARIDSNKDRGNYANVWHNSRFVQVFEVTKGEPVTISFLYRLQ